MTTSATRRIAAAAAIAGLLSAGCGTTANHAAPSSPARTVPSGPPAADLSDIDRYVDADPIKRLAIEEWVITTTNTACANGATDRELPAQVAGRARQASDIGRGAGYGWVRRSNWGPTSLPAIWVDPGPIPVLDDRVAETWCGYRTRLKAWTAAKRAAPILDGDVVDKLHDSDPMKALALQAWVHDTAKLQCATLRDEPETRAAVVRRANASNALPPSAIETIGPLPVLADGQDWCSYAAELTAQTRGGASR